MKKHTGIQHVNIGIIILPIFILRNKDINITTSVIYLIWIDGKSILLDRIKEYKLKIKGVSLHSLQISTTQIIIALVNVVNNFYCQSSSFVMNTMPNLLISIHFVS